MNGDGAAFAFLESNTTGTGREFCAAARARGMRPVLLSRDPGRYPYAAADGVDTVVLDTADPQAVLEACTRLAPAAIASSSEYFVDLAARLAAKLGLPGPDGDAVARCRSKDTQRAVHAAAGVPVPAFAAVTGAAEAARAATRIGFPVVLKPVSGSGSAGVRLCADPEETRAWARRLLADGSATVLVEEAVRGPEFSVETFDGTVVAVVAKHVGPEPYFVETGHDVPAPVPPATAEALGATAVQAVAALGLGYGAAHTELRLGPAGPVVIEVNPRLAGGMIPVAVRAATGVDLVDAVIARAAGQPAAPPGPAAGHAAVRFVRVAAEGRVTAVDGLADAAAAPGVAAAAATTAVGREVRVTHSFQDRLACVVAAGPDPATAARRASAAAALIDITVEDTPR
ncbi:ATP-grasp domain-containing protein [Streptomyces subrutilus]|uniref:ATP-grasp domain-containing protein n=1 Tax=Streptomyces subrutilus TaxID=36818 RepID=UPI002E1668FA|nr:ATP-grasp domain-containing protein [Streptomyces subrutilus]